MSVYADVESDSEEAMPLNVLQPPPSLTAGHVAKVGKCHIVVGSPIGAGSYATVLDAKLLNELGEVIGPVVAVKEMRVGKGRNILWDASVDRALLEIRVTARARGLQHQNSLAVKRLQWGRFTVLFPTLPALF